MQKAQATIETLFDEFRSRGNSIHDDFDELIVATADIVRTAISDVNLRPYYQVSDQCDVTQLDDW